MQIGVVIRTFGVLFLLFSTTLLPPAILSLFYADGEFSHFAWVFVGSAAVGTALWLPLHGKPLPIRNRDGFGIVSLMWICISVLGSLPFMLGLDMSFPDALFESASGFTTTGATVIIGLDNLPPSILFYRQEIQWLGGIGVIVLAIALLPMLGIGGMQLYRAEMPGAVKDERLTPRITQTARTVAVVYVGMTVMCAICFALAGMSIFDAIGHAFSTISTGGFSTHDASIAFFDSPAIETIAIVFMLIGAISFNVHFVVWRTLRASAYIKNEESRAFLLITLGLAILVAFVLFTSGTERDVWQAWRLASFEVASVITSTGFGIADFSLWPVALPVILIFSSIMGGCSGSTAGGVKVIRFLILARQATVYVEKLIHPRLVRPIRIDGRVVPPSVVDGVWAFFAVYVIVYGLIMIVVMMNGMDQVSAFGAVAATLNNMGPGLGEVATTFATVDDASKIVFSIAMILGRLEIFTLLVLLSPSIWRG
jgi:trk system potassium uptake protein TrkH